MDRAALRIRIRDIASTRVHYGYRRIHILLRREGWAVGHKLVYRIYKEEKLGIGRRKPRRNRSSLVRTARPKVCRCNETWSMDFMSDQLFNGKRFRLLTIVDNFSRESLAIRVSERFTGDEVVATLEAIVSVRGKPQSIRVDNGPEFISKSLDCWAYFKEIQLDFSRPGKPTITHSLSLSMGDCGRSASISIGSCRCRTPKRRSNNGGRTTIKCVLTVASTTKPPWSSRRWPQASNFAALSSMPEAI